MSVAAGVALAVREKLRGKIGQTKVHRYWKGKKPEYAAEGDEDEVQEVAPLENAVSAEKEQELNPAPPQVVHDDPRLRRLEESRRYREENRARHREIRQAEIVSTVEVEEKMESAAVSMGQEDDEEDPEEKRRRMRERILQRQREEEERAAQEMEQQQQEADDEEDEEEEEESEYETDSEDEATAVPMIKPVFVKKSERETIAERERLEAEEQAMYEQEKRKLEERKAESLQIVLDVIKREQEQEKQKPTELEGEDVDTDEDPAEEYEGWKVRESARLKRDKEEREAMIREKEEVEKLRKMTEDERAEYEGKNPKPAPTPKSKQKFLQKYYHKGAFFQSEDSAKIIGGGLDIMKRDYSAPTGEDKQDKSLLPKVMQVKQFGRMGRSKWTHLANEDTTRWDSPWTNNDKLRLQYNTKMAGMKPIEKPRGSKGLKRSYEEVMGK